jgi:hypothetical protein
MNKQIIRKGDLNREHKKLACNLINTLPPDRTYVVEIKQYRAKRTLEQNSFLWAVPIRMISEYTGMEAEDVKDYLMSRAFGTKEIEIAGTVITKPRLGTSDLNTEQFNWFLEWIESWAAQELGIIVPKPNEEVEDEQHA